MGKRSCVNISKKTMKEYNRVVNRFVKYDDLKKKFLNYLIIRYGLFKSEF